MLRKTLLLALCLCLLPASYIQAGDSSYSARTTPSSGYSQRQMTHYDDGLCHRGLNGRGEVIAWVRDKNQCQNQSSGQSWGTSTNFVNFHRGK